MYLMKPLLIRAAAILLLTAGFASNIPATQPIPLSIETLTLKADLVLQGVITSKSVQRDTRGRIYTKISLNIAEVWKGTPPPADFVIVQSGGVLGDEASVVSGQEQFELGEEIAAFLVMNQRGEGVVIGISQGKFKLWNDTTSGEKRASNGIHGLGNKDASAQAKSAGPPGLSVAELKQRVRGGAR